MLLMMPIVLICKTLIIWQFLSWCFILKCEVKINMKNWCWIVEYFNHNWLSCFYLCNEHFDVYWFRCLRILSFFETGCLHQSCFFGITFPIGLRVSFLVQDCYIFSQHQHDFFSLLPAVLKTWFLSSIYHFIRINKFLLVVWIIWVLKSLFLVFTINYQEANLLERNFPMIESIFFGVMLKIFVRFFVVESQVLESYYFSYCLHFFAFQPDFLNLFRLSWFLQALHLLILSFQVFYLLISSNLFPFFLILASSHKPWFCLGLYLFH